MVDRTPKEAFDAITDVRGWWAGEIEGSTVEQGDEFTYRYKDFHYSKQRLMEVVPNKKVVWLVTESSINFVQDKNEWKGTKIVFDISKKDDKTQIRFTHEGLIPEQECFDACSNAWTGYITDSLRNYIAADHPNDESFTTSYVVDQTPQEAFDAINNVRGWWSENVEGSTDQLNSVFDYEGDKDTHSCKIRFVELVPGQRVVWRVLENYFSFTDDQNEWIGTHIIFEISKKESRTEVRFTHQGLVPSHECFEVCNPAWTYFIGSSLRSLIATGKGGPILKNSKTKI